MIFRNISGQRKRFKTKEGWVDVEPNQYFEHKSRIDLNEEGVAWATWKENSKGRGVMQGSEKKGLKSNAFKPESVHCKEKSELKKMTKDQLNDYAAIKGIKKGISTYMRKSVMIEKILDYFGKGK